MSLENMEPKIDWNEINTVLLDMDGTLLDLNFDYYFWHEYLPENWAKQNNMDVQKAKVKLLNMYKQEMGKLSWYCLDFWSKKLNFDVLQLKKELIHLIKYRPHAKSFLEQLKNSNLSVTMVTNAHEKLIKMKVDVTRIDVFFNQIISSHSIGHAKEEISFWEELKNKITFDINKTLFIDDNLSVLRSAKKFGIKHLLSIAKPNSQKPNQDTEEFEAIHSFNDIIF
ncbi:MAG: GMP/IMP nucleotidase [Gammaproteobacteria bacterium]|tara:strand:- start:245 stop:919 length:675 start_codon:yes stop_codon:yes gene_type:complete